MNAWRVNIIYRKKYYTRPHHAGHSALSRITALQLKVPWHFPQDAPPHVQCTGVTSSLHTVPVGIIICFSSPSPGSWDWSCPSTEMSWNGWWVFIICPCNLLCRIVVRSSYVPCTPLSGTSVKILDNTSKWYHSTPILNSNTLDVYIGYIVASKENTIPRWNFG